MWSAQAVVSRPRAELRQFADLEELSEAAAGEFCRIACQAIAELRTEVLGERPADHDPGELRDGFRTLARIGIEPIR